MTLTLIGGGVRSGKSAFALALARRYGTRRVFIATAQPYDDDMRRRAEAHQAERGAAFTTVEEPHRLADALAAGADADVIVVDCLTLWLSNRLLADVAEPVILAELADAIATARAGRAAVIVVSNEVGMGIVPEHALGRAFRDLAGRAHQRLARSADQLYLAAMGAILRLRPGPVELVGPPDDVDPASCDD